MTAYGTLAAALLRRTNPMDRLVHATLVQSKALRLWTNRVTVAMFADGACLGTLINQCHVGP